MKNIIGMIHLAGQDTVADAMKEIKIYEEEGLSGIIIENYHGDVSDVIATLDALAKNPTTLSVGINILPNDYVKAFELVNKYDFIDFIQLDYIAGKYEVRGQLIELDADDFIDKAMSSRGVEVYGGVWPKYYTPVPDSNLTIDIFDALFLGSIVVVTGEGTGKETSLDKIKLFRSQIPEDRQLIIGAGLNVSNVKEQLAFADGAIVGSAFKPYKITRELVDRTLVREFMDEVNKM